MWLLGFLFFYKFATKKETQNLYSTLSFWDSCEYNFQEGDSFQTIGIKTIITKGGKSEVLWILFRRTVKPLNAAHRLVTLWLNFKTNTAVGINVVRFPFQNKGMHFLYFEINKGNVFSIHNSVIAFAINMCRFCAKLYCGLPQLAFSDDQNQHLN